MAIDGTGEQLKDSSPAVAHALLDAKSFIIQVGVPSPPRFNSFLVMIFLFFLNLI
jgi:hypothetical protein